MIYLISDTHFGHDKEFIYKPRGFKNVLEMNATEIKNWNKTVTPNDDIYMLGDFFLGTDMNFIKIILERLNGKIHLIIGNHDAPAKLKLYRECSKIVEMAWALQIEYNHRKYFLSHYPTFTADLTANNPQKCVFNLFGHTHSKAKFYEDKPYMYNVAADAHDCTPVSIEKIQEDINAEMKNRGFINEIFTNNNRQSKT